MKNLSIIGCGGHARSVCSVAMSIWKDTDFCFFDDNAKKNEMIFDRFPVLPLRELPNGPVFVALGDIEKRKLFCERIKSSSFHSIVSVVSDNSYLGIGYKVGLGVFVGHGGYLGPEVTIGEGSIVNTGAIVEHEVNVGCYTNVSVNATICGRCNIGNSVYVGAGSVIKDGISICDNAVIGAGAVIVSDIIKPGVYVGCPATIKE